MYNNFDKYSLFLLNKSLKLIIDDKVKFKSSTKRYDSYIVIDNKEYEVRKYLHDDFLDNYTCTCQFHLNNLYCPHIKAVEDYDKIKVTKITVENPLFQTYDIINHEEENEENEGVDFNKIFDDINQEELFEFFQDVLFDNPKIYNQFVRRFKGLKFDCLCDEFNDLLNNDEFDLHSGYFGLDEYKKIIIDFVSGCFLEIKNDEDIITFVKLIFYISSYIFKTYCEDFYVTTFVNSLFYFIYDIVSFNQQSKEKIYEFIFDNLKDITDSLLISVIRNFIEDEYFNLEYIEDLKNKVEFLIENSKANQIYVQTEQLSELYLNILNYLKVDDYNKYELLRNNIYSFEVLLELANICIKENNYDKVLELLNMETSNINKVIKLKVHLLVYKWFKKIDELISTSKILVEYNEIDHLIDIQNILNDNDFQSHIHSLYNSVMVSEETKIHISILIKDFDSLMNFVKQDSTGKLGLQYINYLRESKSKELLLYFDYVINNTFSKKYLSKEELILISKILYKLDTIRGGSNYGVKLTKKIMNLNNDRYNKIIEKSIKKYFN